MKAIKKGSEFFILLLICISCEKDNTVESSVVINELLPVNKSVAADQDGEFDDWIEMYNCGNVTLDLGGYYLTDSKSNLTKWMIPQGTQINAGGYLIFWTDSDTIQNGLHTNFKLSSDGEKVFFVTPDRLIIDKVDYPAQSLQLSYSRVPDGSGSFQWRTPTFGTTNN